MQYTISNNQFHPVRYLSLCVVRFLNLMTWVIICTLLYLTLSNGVKAQRVGINATGAPPDTSAALDIDITTGGLLIPRLTTTQRDNIISPALSLMIFNITDSCLQIYSGVNWENIYCLGDTACITPAAPGAITGNDTVCGGIAGEPYSIAAVAEATAYNWTVPVVGATIASGQGADSITIDWGSASGNVSVTASNSCGTSAASDLAVTVTTCFTTCGTDSVQDADGNWYQTVQIGTQCWMAENLNVGTYVPIASGGQAPAGTQKYCQGLSGVNDPACPFGGLYTWAEMMDGSVSCNGTAPPPEDNVKCSPPVQGICPIGWHVPSHFEWTLLEKNVGSAPGAFPYNVATIGGLGTDEGGNMKVTPVCGTLPCWNSPNTGATNSSGFSALPGGSAGSSLFANVGDFGFWWSSSESIGTTAWSRRLSSTNAKVYRVNDFKVIGFSVRCVQN